MKHYPPSWCLRPRLLRSGYDESHLLCKDLRIKRSKLKLRLYVFKDRKTMRKFEKRHIRLIKRGKIKGEEEYDAIHNDLRMYDRKEREFGDPEFFSVVMLAKDCLCSELIVHESVHAAYAYSRRCKGPKESREYLKENPEEAIAYPAGWIVSAINDALHKAKMWG